MTVLVDTSIWVDYLRNGNQRLAALLESDEVLCHPFIVGELACGRLSPRQEILDRLGFLPMAPSVDHLEALQFIESHGIWEKGVGFIDVHLLASAFLSRSKLWTGDKRLLRVADKLGVAF